MEVYHWHFLAYWKNSVHFTIYFRGGLPGNLVASELSLTLIVTLTVGLSEAWDETATTRDHVIPLNRRGPSQEMVNASAMMCVIKNR